MAFVNAQANKKHLSWISFGSHLILGHLLARQVDEKPVPVVGVDAVDQADLARRARRQVHPVRPGAARGASVGVTLPLVGDRDLDGLGSVPVVKRVF